LDIISGYEGQDVDDFIAKVKEIWEKEGTKPRGAKTRYQIIIGTINQRAAFVPTVSTKGGVQTIIIWNLTQDNIKKIVQEAKKVGLPVSLRPYLWFDRPPATLPNEIPTKIQK
jgi:hypothetical protein